MYVISRVVLSQHQNYGSPDSGCGLNASFEWTQKAFRRVPTCGSRFKNTASRHGGVHKDFPSEAHLYGVSLTFTHSSFIPNLVCVIMVWENYG